MEREDMQEQIEQTEKSTADKRAGAKHVDLFSTSDRRNSLAIYNGIRGNEQRPTPSCFSLAPMYKSGYAAGSSSRVEPAQRCALIHR